MAKLNKFISKYGVRIIAATLCICIVSFYFLSETVALYCHSISPWDSAKIANIGAVEVVSNTDTLSVDVTPGCYYNRQLTAKKNVATRSDSASYLILAVKKGCFTFDKNDSNCFYIDGEWDSFAYDFGSAIGPNPHKEGLRTKKALYFYVDSAWKLVEPSNAGDYIYFYKKVNANTTANDKIFKELTYTHISEKKDYTYTVAVDPNINTDDIAYINNQLTTNDFQVAPYLVSSYGYAESEVATLCNELYSNKIIQ